MLLLNSAFVPHLVDGLMLDPSHPRLKDTMGNDTDASILAVVQRDFAHCISQISLFPPGCEALKADPAVLQALSTLRDTAWSDDARLFAEATLMVLSPPEHLDLEALHVMMSCAWGPNARSGLCAQTVLLSSRCVADQWDVQEIVKRIGKIVKLSRLLTSGQSQNASCSRGPAAPALRRLVRS